MYSHIVFTGGGLSGLSYLGTIRYLQENDFHKHVHEVSGSSIGAFVACLYAMNIMPDEIEIYLKSFFKDDENISFSMIDSIMSIADTYGLDDGKRMIKPLKHFMKKKYGWTEETINFRDFVKKTGVNMVICATNIDTRLPVYFNIDNTPEVCIYDAIKASMSVPIMMSPVTINGEKYVDGGISDNNPVGGFRKSGQNRILVVGASPIIPIDHKPDNFISYISIIMQVMINNSCNIEKLKYICTSYDVVMLNKSPIPFLKLDTYDDGTIKIVVTDDDIDNSIAYGYSTMYNFIKTKREEAKQME
jgi:NTE family protein